MIAASEPLEFVPHGRRAISRHPGSVLKSATSNKFAPPESSSLLLKLKNVAISDKPESAMYFKNVDIDHRKEWWCVRQICSTTKNNNANNNNETVYQQMMNPNRTSNLLNPQPSPNLRIKNDYNSSIRTEINASKRLKCNHDQRQNEQPANNYPQNENKPDLRVDCCFEEELYVNDKTAVWSRGLNSNPENKFTEPESRITIASYTCDSKIRHALFCEFHAAVNDRLMFDALNSLNDEFKADIKIRDNFEEVKNNPIPSICLIDNNSLRAFTESGEDYITSLQFQVKNVWSTKYGILLEKEPIPVLNQSFLRSMHADNHSFGFINNRSSMSSTMKMGSNLTTPDSCHKIANTFSEADVPLPTCFSLSHPLDEMAPVLTKSLPYGVQYYNDGNMQIVYVSKNPSISLTYSSKTGLHSLWKIRKASSNECHSLCNVENKTSTVFGQSANLNLGNTFSPYKGNSTQKNNSSWLGGISSPYAPKSTVSSASKTKNNSSMAGMFNKLGLAPHTSIGQASNSSMQATNVNPTPPMQPLYPDICFDHIWTENQGMSRPNVNSWSAAVKAFLHCDHIGQHYLCYLLTGSVRQLYVARLEQPHSIGNDNTEKQIVVGVTSTLSAKDAINIPSLNLIALIELSGNIVLYSGLYMIGKVHIGGVLSGLINSPYNQTKKFDTSFPRRSSLLPMLARDATLLDESALHQLSPVPHKSSDKHIDYSGLLGLRDAVGNRITLEYDKGVYYRISLPDIASSSLVLKSITALKHVLPKDVVMQVIAKWYGVRNTPGTQDLCAKLEWSMFVSLIFSLLGYDISRLELTKQPDVGPVEIVPKKQKTSCDGKHDDWEYLLNSGHHISFGGSLATMLNLKARKESSSDNINSTVHKFTRFGKSQRNSADMDTSNQDNPTHVNFNYSSLLFSHTLQIFFSLHLLYEELKLNVLLIDELQPLAQFLYQICIDLRLESYLVHYWKDFPDVCHLNTTNAQRQISESDIKRLTAPVYFYTIPPNIYQHIFLLMRGKNINVPYPFLNNVNIISRDIVEIIGLIANGTPGHIQTLLKDNTYACSTPLHSRVKSTSYTVEQKAVLMVCDKGYTLREIQTLPLSISLYLLNTLSQCKANPPENWPYQAYSLIMREDLALQAKLTSKQGSSNNEEGSMKENSFTQMKEYNLDHLPVPHKPVDSEKNTGLEYIDTKILRLRFPEDHRVTEMCNLLQSSIPVTIALTQRPEVSDHDFIEEQERHLYALCTRTMALPVGRGMVTLRSVPCVVTEPLHIPKLCTTGRAPPRNATIELSRIEVPPHYSAWPLFHNGVAAGLKLVPMGSTKIDSAWIVYNKPKQGTVDMLYEHAGFLMALGLNGHLKDMAFMDVYEYLVKCHEMTSVGLLLGIASTYRGTMDISTTKLMGIHVEALLPPTSIELDIPQNIQVAALLGVGLLYQRTAHTHITQVLLSEIGRPPGPEMENSSEREGYSLAAGLGLGLVCLGAYKTAPHHLTSTLRHYMLGGNKRPLTGAQKEKYKLPSFQIREGPTVNVDVTAPGATLALGMLYLKSGNTEVAKWLAPPLTHYLLDFVRPDLLLLRVIARGLILWDSIEPTEEWVENYVPQSVKPYCFVKPTEAHIDYEAMNQVYCNIVAGACFSIGLRFAGSANEDACNTILLYAKEFTRLGQKSIGELAGKSTIETCLNLILISAAMVMAGTGDLQIMRLCRQQRSRAGSVASSLTYGSQLAVHAALGLLFLGAGRYTLSTSPESIAAMICAFFPKFPTHSNDNRYHLQAFRHLYVLATEPRLIIPRDILTGTLCYANIKIIKLTNEVVNIKAPCLLPELHTLKELHIEDGRYWPIVFKRDMNWDQLLCVLQTISCIDIKQRAGCLSYLEDPHGFQSLLAQMLTTEKTNVWSAKLRNIFAFSSDQTVVNFAKHYLIDSTIDPATFCEREDAKDNHGNSTSNRICSNCYFSNPSSEEREGGKRNCACDKNTVEEREFIQHLTMVTYECVIRDTLIILPIWLTLLKILKEMSFNPKSHHVWQIKILMCQMESHNNKHYQDPNSMEEPILSSEPLLSNEFALSIKQKMATVMDSWEPELVPSLKNYLKNVDNFSNVNMNKLATYVTYHDIPKALLCNNVAIGNLNLINLIVNSDISNIDSSCIQNIIRIWNS